MNPIQFPFPALEIPNVLRHGSAPGLGGEEEGEGRGEHQAAEDRDGQPGVDLAPEVHHERRQSRSELARRDEIAKVLGCVNLA